MPDSRRQPAPNPVVASDFDLDGAFFFPGPDGVPIPVIGAGDVTRQLPGTPTRLLASVVPILRRQGDVVTAEGTAFAISQCGLYLTARHCVFPGQGYPPDDEYDEAVGELFILPIDQSESVVRVNHRGLRVTGISYFGGQSDLALLQVDMSNWPGLFPEGPEPIPLSTNEVRVGTHCAALGFGEMQIGEVVSFGDGGVTYAGMGPLHASEGFVEAVLPEGRDRTLIGYPCVQVGTTCPQGMSGGPVFREDGSVIGVVSRGLDGIESAPVEYFALHGPIASLGIPRRELRGQRVTVADFVIKGRIRTHGFQRYEIIPKGDHARVAWSVPSNRRLPQDFKRSAKAAPQQRHGTRKRGTRR